MLKVTDVFKTLHRHLTEIKVRIHHPRVHVNTQQIELQLGLSWHPSLFVRGERTAAERVPRSALPSAIKSEIAI